MERIVDIGCVLAGCLLSVVAMGAGPAAAGGSPLAVSGMPSAALVVCALVAATSALACEWARGRVRVLGLMGYCVLATLVPEGLVFLPAVIYELFRFVFEPLPYRVAPVAAVVPWLVACVVWRLPADLLALAALLSVLSALLSVRTGSLVTQRAMRRRVRDEYRERELFAQEAAGANGVGAACAGVTGAASAGGAGVGVGAGGTVEAPAPACGVSASASFVSAAPVDQGAELHSSDPLDERCRAAFLGLTDREYEVVQLVSEGLDNHEIAATAFISEGTVRNRISAALQKTGCKNRTQLAVRWWRARS